MVDLQPYYLYLFNQFINQSNKQIKISYYLRTEQKSKSTCPQIKQEQNRNQNQNQSQKIKTKNRTKENQNKPPNAQKKNIGRKKNKVILDDGN